MRASILTFSILILTSLLQAQETGVYYRNYASEIVKTEQGLSQNSVRSIMQDSHGLMWFGTWDGLNRFNGLDFEIFRSDYSGKPGQLPNHTINAIFEDRNGFIWLGTERGLSRFNPTTGHYRSYFHNPNDPNSLSNDTVKTIIADYEGTIWVGTQDGLNELVDTSGKFLRFYHQPDDPGSISCNEINEIYKDGDQNLWISTASGLNKLIPGLDKFLRITAGNKSHGRLVHDAVNCVAELPDQNIIVGTEGGISILEPSGVNILDIKAEQTNGQLKSNHIMDLCVDAFGKVWVATSGGGISFYYPIENRFQSLGEMTAYKGVNQEFVNVIFEDDQGIIWIGYSWKGLSKIVPSKSYFNHYRQQENSSSGLASNSVWSVVQLDKQDFFIGTDKGINIFNRINKTFSLLTIQDGLSSSNIRAMMRDSDQNIWIGTLDKGVMRYSPKEKRFKYFGNEEEGLFRELNNNPIWAFMEDYLGHIWIGTFNGLFVLNPDSLEQGLIEFKHNPSDTTTLSSNVIYSLFEDQNRNIWVGTYGGLNKYSRYKNSFRVFRHQLGDETSISTNKIFSINQDSKGFIWVGTMGGGLNRMNPYTGEFKHYVQQDGLANNVVYNIIIDETGYLWLSTNKGLSRFESETETFVNYDINDGIQGYEFNLGAAYKSNDGQIFFGGMNGLNSFYPEDIQENQTIPRLVVTKVRVYNKALPGTYFDGDTIVLTHDDNFFSVEFAALDYTNPVKNQYKYKLKNVTSEWIMTSAEKNVAEFTELSPGTYTFLLQGSNSDGLWNEQGLELKIIIKPAWYQTIFFRVGFLAIIIGILFILIHGRIKRIRKEHQVEKQMFDLERKALRLQMNPHFIFNTLNSIQNYILEHNKTSAISYLNKFSRMMRQVLYNSDKAFVPLSDEISLLKNYIELERLRFGSTFDFTFHVGDDVEEDFIAIPPMLIQPHVENAILHGLVNLKDRKGQLKISFEMQSIETIRCIVQDNGIGREASEELKKKSRSKHKSRGVVITQQRLQRINNFYSNELSVIFEDMKDDSGAAAGTRVVLIIPVEDI